MKKPGLFQVRQAETKGRKKSDGSKGKLENEWNGTMFKRRKANTGAINQET